MSTASTPPKKPGVRSLACPNCGGTVQLRGMGRTLSVVCIQCLSVLDATTPGLQILQKFEAKQRFRPLIPLGTRGTMRGDPYEVIGFQVREMVVEGIAYQWREYVLFNPFKGFRYITEYNGHWNDAITVHTLPAETTVSGRKAAQFLGETYRHYQSYRATTIYVMGEFPWQVRVGETAYCSDFIHPPRILSRESSNNENVWSVAEYTPGETIWSHFKLPGSPPAPEGVFPNQPSPHAGAPTKAWARFAFWILLLIMIQLAWAVGHANKTVFSQRYSFTQRTGQSENSFVTDVFNVTGRISNLEVELSTDLNNNWAFFQLALINADTGHAYDFSRQVSYYHGRDSDGAWAEGRNRDKVVLSSIPPGRYYLRVEPEMDTDGVRVVPNSIRYQIKVTRDVTTYGFFFIGCLLLLIPPVITTIRSAAFETKRWSESDYAGSSGSEDSED
jgi:hypothetical protein